MKIKGFTLIELLAVIVILAIIALIATPIILNIIDDSKESAHKRSLELYKSAVEQAVTRHNLNNKTPLSNGDYMPNNDGTLLTLDDANNFKVSYSGNVVKCNVNLNEGDITLSECTIDGSVVKNDVIVDVNKGEQEDEEIGDPSRDLISYARFTKLKNDTIQTIEINGETYTAHVYNFEGNQTWSEDQTFGDADDVATATEDAKNMVIVKVNGDLTINEGVTVTTYGTEYGGPKGFYLCVTGTLINNGTITMTARGAKAEGQDVYLYQNEDGSYEYVPAVGAKGGAAISFSTDGGSVNGNSGTNGINRQTGGGGTGCGRNWWHTINIGVGGTGTSYSGGSGSGAANSDGSSGWTVTSGAGSSAGGAGSNGVVGSENASGFGQISLGGVGNPTGSYATYRANVTSYKPLNGTGGLLIIYSKNFNNKGDILSDGVSSPSFSYSFTGGSGGVAHAGGSSGAGSINIFSMNINSMGTIHSYGGEKVSYDTGIYSGAGGDGSVSVGIISTNNYQPVNKVFDYTGEESEFIVPVSGTYKLEVWGAQGGNATSTVLGGYGGYSVGTIELNKNEKIYINVGGQGEYKSGKGQQVALGGYNGGSDGSTLSATSSAGGTRKVGGGGGATHIAKVSGMLSELEEYKGEYIQENGTYNSDTILIVSGGGSGNWYMEDTTEYKTVFIGSGGGYIGGQGKGYLQGAYYYADGGTQISAGEQGTDFATFGQGTYREGGSAGGGGGFYGGNAIYYAAAGGSGYIGSSLLTNKVMYCYNCEESEATHTKTISTTNVSAEPIPNYAKKGNGYARITLIEEAS